MLKPCRHRATAGFSLMEALVAMLITSLALLGLAGVQLRTLHDARAGVHRAQAIRLIEDLSERLKVNPNALLVLAAYARGWEDSSTGPPRCDAGCGPEAYAQHDISHWREHVAATLPGGRATTFLVQEETDAGVRRQLGVLIGWKLESAPISSQLAIEHDAYDAPFNVQASDGEQALRCAPGYRCHLQFIQPSARCAPDTAQVATQVRLHCPTREAAR